MNTIENVFWFRLHFLHKTEFHRIHACDGLSVLLLPSLLFTYSHQLRVGARITCTLHAMSAIEIRIRSWKWTLANAWNVVTARRRCLHPNAMDQYNCVRVSARARSNTPNAVFHATNEFSIWVFCLAARPFMRAKPNRRQIIVRPHLDVRCAPNICVRRQNYYFTNYCDRKTYFRISIRRFDHIWCSVCCACSAHLISDGFVVIIISLIAFGSRIHRFRMIITKHNSPSRRALRNDTKFDFVPRIYGQRTQQLINS